MKRETSFKQCTKHTMNNLSTKMRSTIRMNTTILQSYFLLMILKELSTIEYKVSIYRRKLLTYQKLTQTTLSAALMLEFPLKLRVFHRNQRLISKASSRSSRWSSVSSAKIRVAAKRASLTAKSSLLRKQQALQQEELISSACRQREMLPNV